MTAQKIKDHIVLSFASTNVQREAVDTISARGSLDEHAHVAHKVPPHIACRYGSHAYDAAEKIIERCERSHFGIIPFTSDEYPPLLKHTSNPPLVLYTRGHIPDAPYLSVVGTRASDRISEQVTSRLARECAAQGLCIVSGMALGIDRFAHQGAIDAEGSTIAVLPNGIDADYPAANRDIIRLTENQKHSALISEYPPGCRADTWTFVRRNRIISGISPVTVVIKAGEKSGAMITARFSLDYGREVFACGGFPFDEGYAGCQKLIRDGAQILSRTEDITNFYNEISTPGLFTQPKAAPAFIPEYPPGSSEEKICAFLSAGPIDIDTLLRTSGLPSAVVHKTIICLELERQIQRTGSMISLCRGNREN